MTPEEKSEKARLYYRRYYELHREEVKAKRRERYHANPTKDIASSRRYKRCNRDKVNAWQREHYRANRLLLNKQARKRYAEHREQICAKRRTPEYRAYIKELRKRRRIRIVSENLARIKQSLIDNKEANEKRAKQVDLLKGLAQMGDFVPRHKKFRDPND